MTPRQLAEMVELTEGAAYAEMFRAASLPDFQQQETDAGIVLIAPGADALILNRVLGVGVRQPADRRIVEEWIRRYRDAGLRNFGIQISSYAEPVSGATDRERDRPAALAPLHRF